MSRTLHLFGTDWGAMMVPIQVIRWYRMQCYDGTDSCAIVVPIRRYCHPYYPSVADGIVKLTEKSLKLYTEISKNCPLKLWKDRLVAVWGEETK